MKKKYFIVYFKVRIETNRKTKNNRKAMKTVINNVKLNEAIFVVCIKK